MSICSSTPQSHEAYIESDLKMSESVHSNMLSCDANVSYFKVKNEHHSKFSI